MKKDYRNYAIEGTHRFFTENSIPNSLLFWLDDLVEPNVLAYLKEKKINLIINIPSNLLKGELDNDAKIRRIVVDFGIGLLTQARLAKAFIQAFCTLEMKKLKIKS